MAKPRPDRSLLLLLLLHLLAEFLKLLVRGKLICSLRRNLWNLGLWKMLRVKLVRLLILLRLL